MRGAAEGIFRKEEMTQKIGTFFDFRILNRCRAEKRLLRNVLIIRVR